MAATTINGMAGETGIFKTTGLITRMKITRTGIKIDAVAVMTSAVKMVVETGNSMKVVGMKAGMAAAAGRIPIHSLP